MITAGQLTCSKCEREAKTLELRCSDHPIIDPPEGTLEPFDGKPRVRPHTIPGVWQIWSGGICIALLDDKDFEPVVEELRGRLQNATEALRERIEPKRRTPRAKARR